jgi:hypothetical protein
MRRDSHEVCRPAIGLALCCVEKTTVADQPLEFRTMSLLDWYRHKADQCRRLAQRVRNPKERFKIQDEQREWLHIANKELSKDREESSTDIGYRRPDSRADLIGRP